MLLAAIGKWIDAGTQLEQDCGCTRKRTGNGVIDGTTELSHKLEADHGKSMDKRDI